MTTYRIWLGFVMPWTLWGVYWRTRMVNSVFQWNSQFTVTTASFETYWTFCKNFLVEIIFKDWNVFWWISVLAIGLFSLSKLILTFSATSLRTASGISRFNTEKKMRNSKLRYVKLTFWRNFQETVRSNFFNITFWRNFHA